MTAMSKSVLVAAILANVDHAFEAVEETKVSSRVCSYDRGGGEKVLYQIDLQGEVVSICMRDHDGDYGHEFVFATITGLIKGVDSQAQGGELMAQDLVKAGYTQSAGPEADPFEAGAADFAPVEVFIEMWGFEDA